MSTNINFPSSGHPRDLLSVKSIGGFVQGLAVCSGVFLASASFAVAQTESALAIRVESDQVLVPTFVFSKQHYEGINTPAENRCVTESAKALQEKEISVRQLPSRCWGGSILDLGPKDFRLFEDGTEQTVQIVTRQREHQWQLYDNYGIHREYSGTPTGKWSTSDLGSSDWAPPTNVESYVIAYAPPQSTKGSCHQIKVSVDRRNVVVFNRFEYCNVQHAPSDPLEGTKFGQQMDGDLASPTKPKIPMLAASGVFFGDSGTPRLQLVLEFPWNSLHREWLDGHDRLFATIGVLGSVYREDGTLAIRFSDQACCPRDAPSWHYGLGEAGGDVYAIPARYETQLDLPPGGYDLRVVLSDGKKFGRIDFPLSIESEDKKQLDLSSVALCKRFHRVDPPSYTEGILPSKFVPLVSKGIEFTPAADMTFKKRDPLFAYFEVYAPRRSGDAPANVQFRLRITNVETRELKIDSGPRPAAEFLQEDKNVISIVQEIAIHDLSKGNYRLEVQASDSAGNHTPWHGATFTVR